MNLPRLRGNGGDRLSPWLARARALAVHRAVPLTVNLVVLIGVAYSFASWTWRTLQPPPPASNAVAALGGDFDLQALLSANLFGASSLPPSAPAEGVGVDYPRTSLNLVLSGVVLRGAASYALISADGQPETPFRIGETVIAGVVLEAVYPDRAIILRGGARESVPLKEIAQALPADAIGRGAARTLPVTPPPPSVREALREQLQRPEVLSQALIVPNAGGGFLVREVQANSLYEKLGLRTGDVIRSINGQPVNNVAEVLQLYQQLGNASQISIDVTRGGRSETLRYEAH
jgi:general secretion pathway protein C